MVGVGNTAEVFDYGDGKVCKLFYQGYPKEVVEREYRNAKEVERLGLPVPKVFELVESEGRTGIVYEKITGKSMLECIFEKPNEAEAYLEQFVRLQQTWSQNESECSDSMQSYKDYLKLLLKGTEQEGEMSLCEEINALPEGGFLLHGDFHPGNIMITPERRFVVIDFMNVCRGPASYDIARTYALLTEKDEVFGKAYLAKTEVLETEIEPFYKVIEKCRRFEKVGQKKILLTAFYGTSAEHLIKNVKDYEILLLPNDKVRDSKLLIERISASDYDYIIAFGQRPNIKDKVHIETTARDGGICLRTEFDYRLLQKIFLQNGIPAKLSYHAGTSFCNRLYWSGLRYLAENREAKRTKMVFVHVPFEKNVHDFENFKEKVVKIIDTFALI